MIEQVPRPPQLRPLAAPLTDRERRLLARLAAEDRAKMPELERVVPFNSAL